MYGGAPPAPKRLMDGMFQASDSWNTGPDQLNDDGASERKRKRRSRWNTDNDDKTVIPGMPTVIPSNLTESQQRQYVVHLQIEEITRKLRTGDLGIPANPEQRSPSPEPIYNNEGKRLNTREYRTRKKLEEERHRLIQEALKLNPDFKPPSDYKPPVVRVNDKVMIPQEEHPDINFVGLLIGPRGNTLKTLEKDTGAKIIIRGKGSVKDGKIGRKDGQPLPGEDEPLHAYVTANNPENVKKAVEKIKEIIKQGIEVPEGQNDLRRQQLRELALLNGTLRENDGLQKLRQIAESQTIVTNTIICTICGGTGHIAQDCKQKRPGDTFRMQQMQNPAEKAKMDSEYMSLMAELGEGPPPPKHDMNPQSQNNLRQPLLSSPPPNPMGMNNPWQMTSRPPQVPLLSRPPMQNNQMNPMGRMPMPLMSQPMQPPPGLQPPGLLPPPQTQQQQPPPNMGGMGQMPSMQQQQQNQGMMRGWQQTQQNQMSQVSQPPSILSLNTAPVSSGSMGVPPPPPGVLAPPPPPPTSQVQGHPPWMQQQTGKTSLLGETPSALIPPPPPPPPTSTVGPGPSNLMSHQQNLLNIQSQVLQQRNIAANNSLCGNQRIMQNAMHEFGNQRNHQGAGNFVNSNAFDPSQFQNRNNQQGMNQGGQQNESSSEVHKLVMDRNGDFTNINQSMGSQRNMMLGNGNNMMGQQERQFGAMQQVNDFQGSNGNMQMNLPNNQRNNECQSNQQHMGNPNWY